MKERRRGMADKEKLKKLKKLADAMYYAAQYLTTDASRLHKAMEEYHQFIIKEYYKEEPVNEDLEDAASRYAKEEYSRKNPSTLPDRCIGCYAPIMYAFRNGAQWQKNHLWKPADGDDLPEYDIEVIVLTQPYPLEGSEFAVSFAHRPDPKGWDGKSITTGKVEHYTPKTYGKGGWNQPNVKWWLDCSMPKVEED
jgi:hypothetical protein